jgi:hypothetical protein
MWVSSHDSQVSERGSTISTAHVTAACSTCAPSHRIPRGVGPGLRQWEGVVHWWELASPVLSQESAGTQPTFGVQVLLAAMFGTGFSIYIYIHHFQLYMLK